MVYATSLHAREGWFHNIYIDRICRRLEVRYGLNMLWDDLQNRFLAHLPPGARVLELGAGPGLRALKMLKVRPDLNFVIADSSPRILQKAIRNLEEAVATDDEVAINRVQMIFVEADAMDLSRFDIASFDGIFSVGTLKHLVDPAYVFHQVERCLAPNGKLYFSDFCCDGRLSGTRRLLARLGMSFTARALMSRVVDFGLRHDALGHDEVVSLQDHLGADGETELVFTASGMVFTLIHHKKK